MRKTLECGSSYHNSNERTLLRFVCYRFRIPEWAENAIAPNGPLEIMAKLDLITSTGTRQMARLKQGFLIKEIFQHFFEKIESTLEPDRTLWIYSAHDYVIASVLNIFGLYKVCTQHFVDNISKNLIYIFFSWMV